MAHKDYKELARLKSQIKELDERAKEIQKKILKGRRPASEVTTDYGILKLRERTNVEVSDNHTLIKKSSITQTIFINSAKLAISTIKKIINESEFAKLKKEGIIVEKTPTKYYQLEQPLKNQEQL